jgi:hypothetical protein
MTDLMAAFKGISTPLDQLYKEIEKTGWEIRSVRQTKLNGRYVVRVKARNVHGEFIEKFGPDDKTALANLIVAIRRHTHMRTAAQWKLGMWSYDWTHQLPDIAHAYAKAPVYDPKAALAWQELADDSRARADELRKQLHIEITDDPEPYKDAREMAGDIHKNRHFLVSRANLEHPVWTTDDGINFRIVHDILGHAVSGGGFDWAGENLACRAHFPLLSQNAQRALFTECIAQTGYANHYRGFGPQKVAFLDQFLTPAQQQENDPAHRGVHPSQSIAPTSMPKIEPGGNADAVGLPSGIVAPHEEALGLTPIMNPYSPKPYTTFSAMGPPEIVELSPDEVRNPRDYEIGMEEMRRRRRPFVYHPDDHQVIVGPTGVFHSQIDPHNYGMKGVLYDSQGNGQFQVLDISGFGRKIPPEVLNHISNHYGIPIKDRWDFTAAAGTFADPNDSWSSNIDPMANNAYLWHGDPLEAQNVMDNASKVDTNWSNLTDGSGQPDIARMKQAIVNAFRVVLLSPRKDLRWNAIHYQDISSVPADVDDPGAYWDTLENKRRAWNQAQGIDPEAHMPYYKFLKDFQSIIYQRNPELGYQKAMQRAKDTLFDWWTEEQQHIEMEDKDKPADKQRSADEIERRANEALARRLQLFIKDSYNPKTDVEVPESQQPLFSKVQNYKRYVDEVFVDYGGPNNKIRETAKKIKKALKPDEIPKDHADDLLNLYAYLA